MLELIHDELFFVEYEEGDRGIQNRFCNSEGHEVLDHDKIGETYSIQKGICLKCGKGNRFFKMSKSQTEKFKKDLEALK